MKVSSAVLGLELAKGDWTAGLVPYLTAQRLRSAPVPREAYAIFKLLRHIMPDIEDTIPINGLENYGCTGVGNMDATVKKHGRPIDAIDTALNNRRNCINCATSERGGSYSTYQFDENNNSCGNSIIMLIFMIINNLGDALGTASQAFCECDLL